LRVNLFSANSLEELAEKIKAEGKRRVVRSDPDKK
jgi:hypothetical protein